MNVTHLNAYYGHLSCIQGRFTDFLKWFMRDTRASQHPVGNWSKLQFFFAQESTRFAAIWRMWDTLLFATGAMRQRTSRCLPFMPLCSSWYTQLSGKDSHFVSKDSKDSWCNLKELFKDVTWCPRNFLHRFRIELPGSLVGSNTCDQRTLKRHDQLRSFNAAVYDLRITSTSYRAFSHFPIW
jgi:hypothetical protein